MKEEREKTWKDVIEGRKEILEGGQEGRHWKKEETKKGRKGEKRECKVKEGRKGGRKKGSEVK